MRTRSLVALVVAFALGGLAGTVALLAGKPAEETAAGAAPPHPAWTEVQWPFLMDQWGKGKAFRCAASDCGIETNVYIRAKIGFCNCTTGVADDEELERLSDFDFAGGEIAPIGEGRPIRVAWMNGRSRSYAIAGPKPNGKSALSVAFNDHCDAIVATILLGHDRPAAVEPAVLEFLNGKTVLHWAEVALGL